ncbi:pirin family protein [Candidatus Nitrosocosmicus franklandus]|uniref:Pirin-related protein n=1 Tax=Candidatus Nitrosocosmicus franklandianus TaxID=1798806 RepID=A0A484ID63_9ARCH|nr:pirin family protein [Candidatus Nitrosocosmicus franklandus]VFJ13987.1 Pirin-related protein [Candidatus Nitrosocosmicus franklandus]
MQRSQQYDQEKFGDNSIRSLEKIVHSFHTTEGEGFIVNRAFPTNSLSDIDPFLLLDEMGPMDFKPGEAKGAPDHPHRGFETVTYLLDGNFEHKDSTGHSGKLNPGDVQWMTAGSGVIHSEMPGDQLKKSGGRLHGFQLWVNLSKKDKMIYPYYQDVPSEKIPIVKLPENIGQVKVIAGKAYNVSSKLSTRIPIQYLHFSINPGSQIIHPINSDYMAFAYVISGEGLFGDDETRVKRGNVVLFKQNGNNIRVKSNSKNTEALQFLLIAGIPLNEPISRYGPFVMNTQQEISQAIEDFRNGKLGMINH